MRFIKLGKGDNEVLVLQESAILVQRTTAPEQARRLVVADLPSETLQNWGGRLVVENHVNVLRPTIKQPLLKRETLAAVLATDHLDRVMRSLAGSVAVSAYELESLPFPDALTLRRWNNLPSAELKVAVADTYRV
jgi:adenine-specific DNA-methyltransferase